MDNDILRTVDESSEFLEHWGIKGMKWGVRRYQNKDGSLTPAGEARRKKILQDPKLLAKHRSEFTDEELATALKRFQTEKQIRDTTGAETNYQKRERKAQEKAAKKLEKQRAKEQEKAAKEQEKANKEQAKLDEERAKKESKTLAARLSNAADIAGSISKIASASGVTFKNGKEIYNALTEKEDKKKEEKTKEKQKDKQSGGSGGSGGSSSPTVSNIINILGDKDKTKVETSTSGATKTTSQETSKSKFGYDVSDDSVTVTDKTGMLKKSSWKTMSGNFDQRVVGKHTQYGKMLRDHYGDDIVDNGGKMCDALFPPIEGSSKWDGDITDANFDDIPWGAIMKNVKG